MCASPLSFLRDGPPPPKVVLLPDALFFSRVVPVAAGTPAGEVAAQVELALEAVSPFPLAQLYYGWFWQPGAEEAFVYAAYRRRFTSDQTAAWSEAELVIPVSGALVGADIKPATTVIVTTAEGLTAVHWEKAGQPTKVLCRVLEPEATDEARAQAREDLIRVIGGSKTVIDLAAPPAPEPADSDQEIVFRAGDLVSRLPAPVSGALDVRDKGDLALLRGARKRDVILWRVALGCAAALVLFGLGEFALVGGKAWQKTRDLTIAARKPTVDKIMTSQDLANRIDDLVTKRLLPMEMVTTLVGTDAKRKPEEIVFTKVQTLPSGGLFTLYVEGYTDNVALLPIYEAELKKLTEVENVKLEPLSSRGNRQLFKITANFKPEALKPSTS
jgi:hypothetical protein